jgi:hypothetical protein
MIVEALVSTAIFIASSVLVSISVFFRSIFLSLGFISTGFVFDTLEILIGCSTSLVVSVPVVLSF